MRPELRAVIDEILREVPSGGELTLDRLGDAMGARAFSTDEIDHAMEALERAGRRVVGPRGGGGSDRLRAVLEAARAIRRDAGRAPTVDEIAARTGLPADVVRAALALGRVMGR
jgi:hypothetical protein